MRTNGQIIHKQWPHCHCWVFWMTCPSLFALELQQMVEICSRAPAIGECVCHSLVLRCVAIESMMMHGQWPTFGILLQSLTPWSNHWSGCAFPAASNRSSSDKVRETLTASCDWTAAEQQIRNDLKEARLHFRSIQTSRRPNRLHLVVVCETGCSVCRHL